jgi:hypothetical protein
MTRKNMIVAAGLVICGAFAGALFAQGPVVNIGTRHGNLRAAQQAIVTAWHKVDAAQHDNNENLGGHAAKAKEYLEAADGELRAAANVANSHER